MGDWAREEETGRDLTEEEWKGEEFRCENAGMSREVELGELEIEEGTRGFEDT